MFAPRARVARAFYLLASRFRYSHAGKYRLVAGRCSTGDVREYRPQTSGGRFIRLYPRDGRSGIFRKSR